MHHVAIMKKSWKLLPLIEKGIKICEARWYKARFAPWNKIKAGDILYFKDSGDPVTLKSTVTKVFQYEVNNNGKALEIMNRHIIADTGTTNLSENIRDYILNKKYAIFVYFGNVKKIKPFSIDKTGYGAQCAWITVDDIESIYKMV